MNCPPSLLRFVKVFFPIVLVASCERFFTAPLRALSPAGLFVAMTCSSPVWLWVVLKNDLEPPALALDQSKPASSLQRKRAANFETLPVWRFQRTPTTSRAHDDIGASAPEKREQDDDRKGNSQYPQQQAATKAHHVLLWVFDSGGAASDGSPAFQGPTAQAGPAG